MSISDTRALIADLQKAVGTDQVRFDRLTRLLYSTDASNYQIVPVGVTFPRHLEDVIAIHEIAARRKIPLLPRGGGSSLAGQTVGQAIIMDFSRHMRSIGHMRRMSDVDGEQARITVESGLPLGLLNRKLAAQGLMFGPDPASAQRATVGGCIGNNASGAHSILYGMTADHIVRLQVVLASGECVWLDTNTPTLNRMRQQIGRLVSQHQAEIQKRFPGTFRTVAGYALNKIDPAQVNLNWLLAGSEGTLGTVVKAELNLVPLVKPAQRRLVLIHFDEIRASLAATPRILERNPSAIELMDRMLIERTRQNPAYAPYLNFIEGDPASVLVAEFYGESEKELAAHVQGLRDLLIRMGHKGAVATAVSPQEQAAVWRIRKVGLGLLLSERNPAKPIAFVEDAAVPVEHLADYIDEVETAVHQARTSYAVYGHASAGCLHVRPLIDLKSLKGREQYRAIAEAATDAAIKYQGTTTGEHGEGLVRGEFSRRLFGDTLVETFRQVKHIFDPNNLMNPGKVVDAPHMDDPALLRYTPDYQTIPIQTRYDWTADHGFSGAIEMCNGAGVCRKEGEATMCPSYMATLDEAHATRGRANALRLAMAGQLPDGLGNHEAKQTLDLCLSCKACKSECPSSVDMARLKAEFMAGYHDAHGIPLKTRLFANVHRLNQLGSLLPTLSNGMMNGRFGRWGMARLGMGGERPLPQFAARRFTKTIQRPQPSQPKATLIIDTFTEFNHPEVGAAFLQIVDALGIEIELMRLPGQGCCGRPAISKGVLDHAKVIANQNVRELRAVETPLVFLEPSCLSAFVDDYPALVDGALRPLAEQLRHRCLQAEDWLFAQMENRPITWDNHGPMHILLHGHCHQKALWGTANTLKLLKRIPHATVTEIDSGCCGMAGSFGYEYYDLSMTIAQQRLLPAIEQNPEAVVVAPGTSCRTQITDANHTVLHPIELIAQTIKKEPT